MQGVAAFEGDRGDVYFLQEAHFNKCVGWPREAFNAFHSTHSAGVAIHFSQNRLFDCFLLVEGINIIGGDFNCIDSVEKDSLRHTGNTLPLVGSNELLKLTSQFGLVDSYRTENPEGIAMTWYGHNGAKGSRIHRFFCYQFFTDRNRIECFSIL